MPHLPTALATWNTPAFAAALKNELQALGPMALPLERCLSISSAVLDMPIEVLVFGVEEMNACIHARVGIFFSGVIAGCSCADDPTPIEAQNEYCELRLDIDKVTGEATFASVD